MNIINTKDIATWRVAKKTKSMRAKPMVTLVIDKTVMAKFLIDTLEAREQVSPNAMFCIGETNDAWQQTPKTLLMKYDVTDVDADGWMMCTPKPDNNVEFVEATEDGFIVGVWGETIDGVENLQAFIAGDCIVRNREEHKDVWIVRQKIWINSYTEITSYGENWLKKGKVIDFE
jgi:hypothetical protein